MRPGSILNNRGEQGPRVMVAERVIAKMAAGASLYPEEETAEALVGLVVPVEGSQEPDLYVLDTIPPDPSAIERAGHMVEQGDSLQDETLYWLAVNWRRFRERRRQSYGSALAAKWDVPLRYLGDWHKQPGGMFWPSQGDLMTALDILHDASNDMPQLLVPIVTLAPEWDEAAGPPGDEYDLYVRQPEGPPVRINFWYLSRRMRQFVAARPEVLPDQALPALPPLAWHIKDRERFQREYELLSGDGLAVSVVEWDADDRPPLEICFMVGRVSGEQVIILITDRNYPAVPPTVRTAPMCYVDEGEDLFTRLWEESRPLEGEALPKRAWSPEMTLLDVVRAVEGQAARDGSPQAG